MGNPLFDRRTAAEWAAAGHSFEFVEDLGRFERLSAALAGELATLDDDEIPADWRATKVHGEVSFRYSGERGEVPTVSGSASVVAPAVCQRCLKPFGLPLSADFRLVLGPETDGAQSDEVWELDDGMVRPGELIDELLVMAMPFAPRHDNDECRPQAAAAPSAQNVRPFADLRRQMDEDNESR